MFAKTGKIVSLKPQDPVNINWLLVLLPIVFSQFISVYLHNVNSQTKSSQDNVQKKKLPKS